MHFFTETRAGTVYSSGWTSVWVLRTKSKCRRSQMCCTFRVFVLLIFSFSSSIVVTLSSLVTWPHKTTVWYATISPEKSTIDGKRATKSTSAGTHTVAQWLVASNLDLRARRQKRKNWIWTITRAIVVAGYAVSWKNVTTTKLWQTASWEN